MSVRHSRPGERWPARQERRYTTGSVTGYAVSSDTAPAMTGVPGQQKAKTIWYVYDAAHGYAFVASFRDYPRRDRYDHGAYTRRPGQSAKGAARTFARILNDRNLDGLA